MRLNEKVCSIFVIFMPYFVPLTVNVSLPFARQYEYLRELSHGRKWYFVICVQEYEFVAASSLCTMTHLISC
jgi:hypothetical protein